jgi:RNA polymerase sigma factor (sigma-70 family)
VQDAYLRAIRHFGGFKGDECKAWFLTIVRNLCYDSLRHKGRARTMPFDEEFHNTQVATSDPEAPLLQQERAGLLRQALEELPLEYREVLVLRELEELSYREIAHIAKIPVGTVMSRLSRARGRLQFVLSIPQSGEKLDSEAGAAARC